MKPDDRSIDGTVDTLGGDPSSRRADVDDLKEGRSKEGSAKGKTAKKAKGKSAKQNGRVKDRLPSPSDSGEAGPDPLAPPATPSIATVTDAGVRTPGERVSEDEQIAEGNEDRGQPTSLGNDAAPATEALVSTTGAVVGSDPELSGTSDERTSPPSSARRRRRSKAVLIGVLVLVTGLVVALILSLLALSNQDSQASSRTSALAAARTYAVQLASYNYGNLQRDFAAVAANSTPSFRRSFTESSDALKSTLTQYKATAAASVVSAGLVSSSTSEAVVLVFLTQKIENSSQAKPTTDRSQVQITLVRSGGRWLINQVTLL